jgi:hypothetical protein
LVLDAPTDVIPAADYAVDELAKVFTVLCELKQARCLLEAERRLRLSLLQPGRTASKAAMFSSSFFPGVVLW